MLILRNLSALFGEVYIQLDGDSTEKPRNLVSVGLFIQALTQLASCGTGIVAA